MTTIYKPRSGSYVRDSDASGASPSESLIDRHSHFNGVYRTSHDLRIEGTAEGEIECDGTVTVAPDTLDGLIVEEGAVFEGEFQMADAQAVAAASAPAATPPLTFPALAQSDARVEEDEEEDDKAASDE